MVDALPLPLAVADMVGLQQCPIPLHVSSHEIASYSGSQSAYYSEISTNAVEYNLDARGYTYYGLQKDLRFSPGCA